MRKWLFLLLCLPLLMAFKLITDCGCNHLGEAEHKRDKVKDRAPVNTGKAVKMSFAKFLKMGITAPEKASIKANDDKPLEREKKIVSVSGYAWVIKLSSEDCDIHIELSEKNDKDAPRIIAEIPNTTAYCDFHQRILSDLQNKFHLSKKNDYRFDKTDNEGKSIPLTVAGYLFWDSGHPTNANHGSDKVASVWEVHPVCDLKWK